MLNQNRYRFTIKESQKKNINFKEVANVDPKIDEKDDDFLDISDTELIRASQAVESQLKFTNNVHHATSNAITIFSQFTQNACDEKSNFPISNPNTHIKEMEDDLKHQLKQLRSTNMQKDGEVKILRDKLRRFEQEMQKMRTEKIDLIKKLQQQQDETKRSFQKQIEYKELENQFKSQEIVELTMKYKVLESSVKKNPNTVVLASTPLVNQKIQQSKSAPLKRSAQFTNDIENENPDIKRALLSNRCNRPTKPINHLDRWKNSKRVFELNVRDREIRLSNSSNLIYKLTDKITQLSYFLKEIASGKASKDFIQNIRDLSVFLKNLFCVKIESMNIETVDFICSKLNDELFKLFNLSKINCDSRQQIDIVCLLFENLCRLFLVRFDIQIDSENLKQASQLKDNFILLIKQFLDILNLNLCSSKDIIYYANLSLFNVLLDMFNFVLYSLTQIKSNSKTQTHYLNLIESFHSISRTSTSVDQSSVNNDEECCIFQLIFDKISSFFTDTSYILDQNEKVKSHNELSKGESNQPEIITTIGDEAKHSKIDFKLENKISENYLMNNSLSEVDDILQSQVEPVSPQNEEPNIQHVLDTVQAHNSSQEPIIFENLKLECFYKLMHFIYNYQIVQSIGHNAIKLDLIESTEQIKQETSCKKRKIYQSMSNLENQEKQSFHNACICFKNILNSFLSLLDYLFGDKSYCLDRNESKPLDSSIYFLENNYEHETDQYKSLLLLIGLNVFMSMTNVDKLGKDISVNRIKLGFINPVMEDYKIKNFLCLTKIFESEFTINDEEKMEVDQTKQMKQKYLSNSFNSLKSLFKNCVDDYFDFTKN
ncbi:ATR-interacting -like isoform X2 [Brachionus plicatilis]|uniref:ATR-interacting-like isoform X2 n=1 Tax=Brachionus plicatilis TaxID=10195 RepID=A0A3M7T812_BRAPC|nr:ATR-interacting -like isoform X2 [Brachionus plicatilis]